MKKDTSTEPNIFTRGLCFLLGSLEDPSVLRLAFEWNTKFEKLDEDIGEFLEEDVRVLGISRDVLLEFLVLNQSHVGGKHHQGLGSVVGELVRTVPLFQSQNL